MKIKYPKQEAFCQEYIIDFNKTAAAKRAKYSEKTAYSIGYNLLKKVEIQERIMELIKNRSERTQVTQDMVLKELMLIGFSDLADYLSIDENTGVIIAKSFDEMKEGKSRALESIKEDRAIKEDAKGEQVTVYDKVTFKMHSKIRALELLGKHLGMFTDLKIDATDELKELLVKRIISSEKPQE